MAQCAERTFYTFDHELQEALKENESFLVTSTCLDEALSETSDESNTEALSETSDESNAEFENDTPIDACEDIEERAMDQDKESEDLLENLADHYYQHDGRAERESGAEMANHTAEQEAEQCLTRERFQKGCGCSLNCFSDFTISEVAHARLALKALSKNERDMLLLGKLQTFYQLSKEGSSHLAPKRARLTYAYDSREVCEGAFCFIHGIGDFSLRSLKKHLRNNGITPRIHGNKGRKPAHSHTRVDILKVLTFIHHYARINGLPQPAPPRGRAGQPLVYLPASQNKKIVYKDYECSCALMSEKPVGYRSFRNIWRKCLPWICFMTPRTDVCYRCELHRLEVKSACDENEKKESLKRFSGHLEVAQLERDFYRKVTNTASKEIAEYKGRLNSRGGACVRNLRASHYTFDFAQSVSIPYHARQPGPVYFKTARKVHLFGVCNEGIPKQVNYLLDESQTIGENGKMAHGPNSVISMLHHYFAKHGLKEKGCVLHADNCAGQNKNRSVIGYLAWRCMTGLHEEIQLSFMVAGHTRCLVDGCFGLIKQKYRKSDCDTLEQLQKVVEESASVNSVQLYQELGSSQLTFQWYDWVSFLDERFKAVQGIRSLHHFRFSKSSPGSVFVKDSVTAVEQKLSILRATHPPISRTLLPSTITAGGLTLDRKQYLFKTIREHVWDPYKDITCPDPSV